MGDDPFLITKIALSIGVLWMVVRGWNVLSSGDPIEGPHSKVANGILRAALGAWAFVDLAASTYLVYTLVSAFR